LLQTANAEVSASQSHPRPKLGPSQVRLSVGIETGADLLEDLRQALAGL
jgi:cystathionine beta-lyase/cystathionine gamma-synthase